MNYPTPDSPPDYSSMTNEELDRIIKTEYASSDKAFGAIVERHRRELKKPHLPSFWLLVIAVILSFMALCVAIFALPQVQRVFSYNQKLSIGKEPQKQEVQNSQKQESNSYKKSQPDIVGQSSLSPPNVEKRR